MSEYCPNADHDGALAPVERVVTRLQVLPHGSTLVVDTVAYCAHCAEGYAHRALSHGWGVNVTPVVQP